MKRRIVVVCILGLMLYGASSLATRGVSAYHGQAPGTPGPTFTPQPTHIPPELKPLYPGWQGTQGGVIPASASPVRGVAGDWWADVIVGQPSFGQITPNRVVANKLFNPGGILVDRTIIPNRVYVYDAGNSRILGFSSLGVCGGGSNAGKACTSKSDCPGSACSINATKRADLIIGQVSAGASTCNGDSAFQHYPNLSAPSASTLCGLPKHSISILEAGSMATMDVDVEGNLYHPDFWNNRVLRYNSPFSNDTIADFVWGQANFGEGDCNEGRGYGLPDSNSLCLEAPNRTGGIKAGVAVDANGNLWVADTHNNRVLRFPYDPGRDAAAPTANLVLGQADFSTAVMGSAPAQMNHPGSVRVDSSGKVYVLDGLDGWGSHGRLLVFNPPFSNGMAAHQVIEMQAEPTGLELDPNGGLWINNGYSQQVLRLVGGELQLGFGTEPSLVGGLGIDRDKSVMLTGYPQQVMVYTPPAYAWSSTFLQADYYASFNKMGARGMAYSQGLEVTDDQLVVSDGYRLLFWNHPIQLTNNYPPADGVIGQPDFNTRLGYEVFGRMRADTHRRLWVVKGNIDLGSRILAYQLPLVSQALPTIEISSPIPLQGGGSFTWSGGLHLAGIAYQPGCDCLWLSDTLYSRVFRIRQVSSSQRAVDIVLGQTDEAGIHCNQGRDPDEGEATHPSRDSLCHPGGLATDKRGNLFVSDHNLEVSGNWRMLEYDATDLPLSPATALFAVPASRVYGRNGSFTEPRCQEGDPMCGPWEPVFYPNNDMVIGFNTYIGPPFPQVYHDPLSNPLPYTALMDFYSHAYSMRLDSLNNLFVLDLTRNRVLIYKAVTHTISGNAGVSGAILTYTDGKMKRTTTSGNGAYSFDVTDHWSGTVTPSKAGVTFTPSSRSYIDVTSDQPGQNYAVRISLTSIGAQDGWVLESTEARVQGGSLNAGGVGLVVGDDAADRQYRSILSFNTAALPDTAVITKVTLKLKGAGVVGTNPLTTHGNLVVDVRKGPFASNAALQIQDFQALAGKNAVMAMPKTPVNGWYSKGMGSAYFGYINKSGLTQFRLRFTMGDNDDMSADYIKFYSGNVLASLRPQLIIQYYVP